MGVRVESLAKQASKEKQLDSYTTHRLFVASHELDEAEEEIEIAVNLVRPNARKRNVRDLDAGLANQSRRTVSSSIRICHDNAERKSEAVRSGFSKLR